MIRWLISMINTDTPSQNKAALDAFAKRLAGQLEEYGAEIQWKENQQAGDHLKACFVPPEVSRKPLLILGHMDTVWDLGESIRRPARLEEGRIYGPGAFDMRGGLTLILALGYFISQHSKEICRPVTILLDSDEEVGSVTSRAVIEEEARKSELVLVVEPCLPGGALKTARKGVGGFVVTAKGVAAHSGVDYQKGVNAIAEIAHQILEIYKLNDLKEGTTVNVGVIKGGSRPNVIADHAEIEVDLRVSTLAEGERITKQMFHLKPKLEGAGLKVSGGINRPPLERTEMVVRLFQKARALAGELGIELEEGSTGGGSDGCFTAALGIPTLDGLGPDGAGLHALHEHVVIGSLAPRAALLTQLVMKL